MPDEYLRTVSRRDPEALGRYILNRVGERGISASQAADDAELTSIPRYKDEGKTIVHQTSAAYKEQLLGDAETDVHARDLAEKKGWLGHVQCFTFTRDGLQQCIHADGHNGDHSFPDGTNHV